MSRIVLDPGQLAATASQLDGAAGEYQAIGSRVAACDCGCMPADVAAVVDATTAMVRSQLDSVSAWLSADSADLAWRAGVPQDGSSAISAASGGGYVTIGGYSPPEFQLGGAGSQGSSITIGGYSPPEFNPAGYGGSTITIGGGFDTSVFGGGGGGSTMTIGGTWGYDPSTNPMVGLAPSSMTIGGTWGYDPSTNPMVGLAPSSITIGPAIGPGFDVNDWGLGGSGYGPTVTVGGLTGQGAAMSQAFGIAARNNDWWAFSMLQNISASQQRTAGIWTLPDGWRYANSIW